MLSYLEHVRAFWCHDVFRDDEAAMQRLDYDTVRRVQLTAPGANHGDWRALEGDADAGRVFGDFTAHERRTLLQNLRRATAHCTVPSLYSFFEDIKYLRGPAGCMRRLVPLKRRQTFCAALARAFVAAPATHPACHVQASPYTAYSVAVGADAVDDDADRVHFRLAYLQLWLCALRDYCRIPATIQRKLAQPHAAAANECVLFAFARLAHRLGFDTGAPMAGILAQSPESALARRLLLEARPADRYRYANMEASIDVVVSTIATARPRLGGADNVQDANDTNGADNADNAYTDDADIEPMDNAADQPAARCGLPKDAHQLHDRRLLYLPTILQEDDHGEDQHAPLTSFFVQRSTFFAFFIPTESERSRLAGLLSGHVLPVSEEPEPLHDDLAAGRERAAAQASAGAAAEATAMRAQAEAAAAQAVAEAAAAQAQAEAAAAQAQAEAAAAQVAATTTAVHQLSERHRALEGLCRVLERNVAHKEAEGRALDGVSRAHRDEDARLQSSVSLLSQTRNGLQADVDALRTSIATLTQEDAQLRETLEASRAAGEEWRHAHEARVERLNDEVKRLRDMVDDYSRTSQDAARSEQQYQRRAAELATTLSQTKQSVERLQQQEVALQAKMLTMGSVCPSFSFYFSFSFSPLAIPT